MKSKIIVLLLLFTWNFGLAQNKLIDSLKYQLAIAKQDTSRVLIMADLARSYSIVKPDSGMKYAQQALELAQKIKYLEGEATALNNLAGIYREQGDLPSAMNLILKAFSIAEAHQFVEVMGECYSRFGNVYFDLKDFTKSLYYNQRAYEVSVKLNDQLRATNHMMNIGSSFLSLNQLDSAIHYTQLAYERVIRLNLTYQLQTNFRILGRIQVAVGNNQLALDYFKQSIEAAIKMNESRNASYSYNEIGRIFLKQNQIDSCIFYAKKGLAYAQVGPFNKRILESSVLLAEAFKNKNDFKQAYEYQELMVKTKESLYSAVNIQAMQTMLADDETKRKEVETERIANKNRLKQYTLLTGLAMLLLFTFFLYRNIRQKQKANKVLKSTLTNLKSTQSQLIQSEKMASLGELTAGIAHEIQNPLNFVNNFSEVNKELLAEMRDEIDKGNLEEVKLIANDVIDNEQKINEHGKRADAIVKGMLQHSRSSSGVKEATDINALCDEYLRLAYHGLRAKDKSFNATMKTDFDESIGNINIIPQDIGRVVLNLINNAFYAVDEKRNASTSSAGQPYEPTVSISTKKIGDKVEIKVADNGNGIPPKVLSKVFQPFFTTKPTGQGTGLGLSLSYDIVKAHGGELKVETKEGEGTLFVLVLPG